MLGYSFFQLVTFVLLGGGILVAMRSRQVRIAGPTLVLRRFEHGGGGPLVIQGRAAGVIGWLLTTMGLDVDTTLEVTPDAVSVKTSGLAGEIKDAAPLADIASTVCGYAKPAWALVVGVVFTAYGLLTLLFQGSSVDASGILLYFVIAAAFIIPYVLSQRLIIAVETSGGRMMGVAFKRSVIENTTVSFEQAQAVTATINALVAAAKRPTLV